MVKRRRNIALIVDNAPRHKDIKLSNIKLVLLPPNMTGALQPLDAGIIRSFKASYRKQQMNFLIDHFDDTNIIGAASNDLLS